MCEKSFPVGVISKQVGQDALSVGRDAPGLISRWDLYATGNPGWQDSEWQLC